MFYTTGRLTSEMVIKCAQMRIPFLVSRSGLTNMGYQIAKKVNLTMLGRASGRHYLAFTGQERLVRSFAAADGAGLIRSRDGKKNAAAITRRRQHGEHQEDVQEPALGAVQDRDQRHRHRRRPPSDTT